MRETLRLCLSERVLARFPATDVRVLVADGFSNAAAWAGVEDEIADLEHSLGSSPVLDPVENDPAVAEWFAAYRAFGTNPKRFRPSVYALLVRVRKTGLLPRVAPAVDAYNLVSVAHRVPAGAFDLAKLAGPVVIRFAAPGDRFVPLGQPDQAEAPRDGEVVYAMGDQVLTRHWNHRDSELTKVDEHTTSAVFLLDGVSAESADRLDAAQHHLERLLRAASQDVTVHRLAAGTARVPLPR